jgi:hypothetical protein
LGGMGLVGGGGLCGGYLVRVVRFWGLGGVILCWDCGGLGLMGWGVGECKGVGVGWGVFGVGGVGVGGFWVGDGCCG